MPDTLVTLMEPEEILTSGFIVDATCGDADGSINVEVQQGFPPYTYAWNTGETTEDLTDVSAAVTAVIHFHTGAAIFGTHFIQLRKTHRKHVIVDFVKDELVSSPSGERLYQIPDGRPRESIFRACQVWVS